MRYAGRAISVVLIANAAAFFGAQAFSGRWSVQRSLPLALCAQFFLERPANLLGAALLAVPTSAHEHVCVVVPNLRTGFRPRRRGEGAVRLRALLSGLLRSLGDGFLQFWPRLAPGGSRRIRTLSLTENHSQLVAIYHLAG